MSDQESEKKRKDAKLFQKEYRKARREKEKKQREKKKTYFIKGFLFLIISLLLSYSVFSLLPLLEPKEKYIETGRYTKVTEYEEINGEILHVYEDGKIGSLDISAKSALLFNPVNGSILFKKNIDERRAIASLNKILSAIVILEKYPLDLVIDVNRENIPENLDWQLGLKDGDKISIESALKAMLVSSYNDVGYIVANAYPEGGYFAFVEQMNIKAESLRMFNSHFMNPSGIDQEGSYSTAMDVALLVSSAMKYEKILEIVGIEKDVVKWSRQEQLITAPILTTNDLKGSNANIVGFKTGVTTLAGRCFVGYFKYKNGKELVTVVLDSQERFEETELLERYASGVL